MKKLALLVLACLSITACGPICPTDPDGYARCQEQLRRLSESASEFRRSTEKSSGYIYTPRAPIYYQSY